MGIYMETKSSGLPDQNSFFSSPVRDETDRDFFRNEITLMDKAETDAQKALQERPSFSIRARLSLGFFLFFILSFGVTVAALVIISRIESKLKFMEAVSIYTFEIQQARRFEKNFFLYRTNFNDALDNVHMAQQILFANGDKIKSVVGIKNYDIMLTHVERYEELLTRLPSLQKRATGNAPQGLDAIETELRTHGGEMVSVAQKLVDNERQSVDRMLSISKRVPLIFLIFLLLLIIYMVNFLARQMLGPLTRLMEATQQIAAGDFTPLRPARRYRDEFTNLAVALNRMIHELQHRQEVLIQSHKLQAVGTLTAGVAHELNNPINNIMLTADMLLEDYKDLCDEERLEMVKDLVDQAERSKRIVSNLLDFARESELKSEPLNIEKLINETIQLVSNQIKLSKVKPTLEVPSNLPPLHGDRQQLTQVLLNLILNALDAMPQGGLLKISARNSKERNFIEVQVSDTGVGIPEHLLPSIFDPFFSRKTSGKKGTGLGLSVSLGIIRKHGGDVRVESKINEGTTFIVVLPTAQIPADISSG
jgi:Osmosensitive K+ channel histidine kinase